MTLADHHRSPEMLEPAAQQFLLWALDAFGLEVQRIGPERFEIHVPAADGSPDVGSGQPYAFLDGRQFCFAPPAAPGPDAAASAEIVRWDSPLLRWLLDELGPHARPLHAAAAAQPQSVHELAEHLFAQYQVDGGHMHLAGCSLDDRPFLRLTWARRTPQGCQLEHCFGTGDGELLDAALHDALELDHLVPLRGGAPKIGRDVVSRWSELTQRQFAARSGESNNLALIAVTLVWCKHAEGKLTVSIGQETAEIPFSGWGRLLAARRSLPPPYTCPWTGRSSYHLAATDDGRITVAEAIGTCCESSRRVLDSELVTCSVTGRRALAEYICDCPCTGQPVLRSAMEVCSLCGQSVSPRALEAGRCRACCGLEVVPREHPVVARLLEAYPALRRARSFQFAESAAVEIVIAKRSWKRTLLVVDKQSGALRLLATSHRFSATWQPVVEAQHRAWLS